MPGRHHVVRSRRRFPLAAAVLCLLGFIAALASGALIGGSVARASTPDPNYHPGSDNATFTVTGVLDGNCLVSTGGTEIWIKPGDKIVFDSSLVGINVGDAIAGKTLGGLLGTLLKPSQVAGLDVTAVVDPGTSKKHTFTVGGGSKTTVPATALSSGDHKIDWTATGLALLPALHLPPIRLSDKALKSGASLSWSGVIHVTSDAAKCKLGISTPRTKISVGPIKVTVPPVGVGVPQPSLNLPTKLPGLGGKSSGSSGSGGANPGSGSGSSGGDLIPVPAKVVPKGNGDAVFGNLGAGTVPGVVPGGGGAGAMALQSVPSTHPSAPAAEPQQNSTGKHKTIDLASTKAQESAQLPVVLAIIAVIALSLVAATYARLYLLRKEPTA